MVAAARGFGVGGTNVWELTPPMAIAPVKYAKGRFVSFATAMPRGIRITNVTSKKTGMDNRNAVSPKAQGAFLPGNAFNMDFARDSGILQYLAHHDSKSYGKADSRHQRSKSAVD